MIASHRIDVKAIHANITVTSKYHLKTEFLTQMCVYNNGSAQIHSMGSV